MKKIKWCKKTLSEIFMDEDLFSVSNEKTKKEFEEEVISTFDRIFQCPPCQGIIEAFKNPKNINE